MSDIDPYANYQPDTGVPDDQVLDLHHTFKNRPELPPAAAGMAGDYFPVSNQLEGAGWTGLPYDDATVLVVNDNGTVNLTVPALGAVKGVLYGYPSYGHMRGNGGYFLPKVTLAE